MKISQKSKNWIYLILVILILVSIMVTWMYYDTQIPRVKIVMKGYIVREMYKAQI